MRNFYWLLIVFIALGVSLGSCEREIDGSERQDLSIYAPNGLMICTSISEYEKQISNELLPKDLIGSTVKITDIEYIHVTEDGYFMNVSIILNKNTKSSFSRVYNLSNVCDKNLNPILGSQKSKLKAYFFCIDSGSCTDCIVLGGYNPETQIAITSCSCAECILEIHYD